MIGIREKPMERWWRGERGAAVCVLFGFAREREMFGGRETAKKGTWGRGNNSTMEETERKQWTSWI